MNILAYVAMQITDKMLVRFVTLLPAGDLGC